MGKDTRKWTTSPNGRVMAGRGALATSSTHDVLLRNGRTWLASNALKEAVPMLQRWRSSRDTAHGGRSAASEDQMPARHSCNPQNNLPEQLAVRNCRESAVRMMPEGEWCSSGGCSVIERVRRLEEQSKTQRGCV